MRRTKVGAFLPILLALATLVPVQVPARAFAQDAYSCIDRLSDAEVQHRLAFIVDGLDAGKRHARMWWYGWMTFALGAAAFTWTTYALTRGDGHDDRDPALVAAIGSSGLVVQSFSFPLWSAFAPQRLRRLPEGTPEERRAKLRHATRLLHRSADREAFLRGIGPQIGPFIYAIGTGTFLAVRHDVPFATAIAFLAPPIIGESKVLSVPWRASRNWERYRSFACQPPHPGPGPGEEDLDAIATVEDAGESQVAWSVVPALGGLGLRLEF